MSNKATENYITWTSDTEYAFGYCKLLTQLLGIWPLDCQRIFPKARVVIVIISQVILCIHCICEIRGICMKPHDVVYFVGVIDMCALVTLKILVLRGNRSRMKLVIMSIAEDWIDAKDPKSYKTMRSYASFGRSVFIYQSAATLLPIGLTVLGSLPIANNKIAANRTSLDSTVVLADVTTRDLPMGTECFVADLPTSLYVAYYVLQLIQAMIITAGDIGNDIYFLCIVIHICGQFELLKERLGKIGDDRDISICGKELRIFVSRYNRLMTLLNHFENVFNPIILGVLAVDALFMSLLGLQVIICFKDGDIVIAMQGMFTILILSLQIFLYSYAGEHLSSHDGGIRDTAYNCSWYDLPPTIVRDITIVITKSSKEFQLTAGRVFQMNLNNFKVIMKTMFSYFSMLRIMFEI